MRCGVGPAANNTSAGMPGLSLKSGLDSCSSTAYTVLLRPSTVCTLRGVNSASSAMRLFGEIRQLIDEIDSTQLAGVDEKGYRTELDRFVSTMCTKLSMLSDAITAESFALMHRQHAMAGPFDTPQPLDTDQSDRGAST